MNEFNESIVWVDFKLGNEFILEVMSCLNSKKNIVIGLDFSKFCLNISVKDFLKQNVRYFFSLIDLNKVDKFYFKELDFELFERIILKPKFRNKYFDKFICEGYELKCDMNFDFFKINEKIQKFESLILKNKGLQILNLCENIKNKSNFVLVESKFGLDCESSSERFVCYLFNDKFSFEVIWEFCEKEFDSTFIGNIEKFLRKSEQIVVSFAVMKNGDLRKTIYFNVDLLKDLEIKNCFGVLNLNLDPSYGKVWGVGLDFIGSSFKKSKIYYENHRVSLNNFKDFLNGFEVGEFFNVLNFFRNNKFDGVLFDSKFENGLQISKRVDISLVVNEMDFDSFSNCLHFKNFSFKDKFFYTLSFEFYENESPKVNLYYSFKK